jgi:hypothetical protein
MRTTEFLPLAQMSPVDVLEVIRDRYRHAAQLDPEAERGLDLTLDSTVADWRASCDLLPTRKLGPALNDWFGVSFSGAEWAEVLEPGQSKTLRGVSELIATQASRPVIRPFRVSGTECLSAGTFLTVRSLLVQAGMPVQHVRPSSALAPYARQWFPIFITEIGKLAPGALPVPTVEETTANKASMTALGIGFLVLITSIMRPELLTAAAILLPIGYMGLWITSRYPPRAVRFGTLATFRDLAEAVVHCGPDKY